MVKLERRARGLTVARLEQEHTGVGKRICAQKSMVSFHAIVTLLFLLEQQKT